MGLRLLRGQPEAALAVLAALGCGCAASQSPANPQSAPAGTEFSSPRASGPAPGSAQLTLKTDTPVRLGFKEQSTIDVLLTNADDTPVTGGHVSFALVGRAQDSSLAKLDADVDENGIAENTLIAGKMTATFRVRISAPGAYDTFVDVAVSDAGFGTLSVDAPYTGQRPVAQRIVFAQANMRCMQSARMAGDPMVALSGSDAVARFLALPAAVSYAVTVEAQSKDGTVVARGCTDQVMVKADSEVMVSIDYKDEPLQLSGQYALQADLDSSAPAITLSNTLRSAAESAVNNDAQGQPAPTDAEGRFLLDSLDGTLRSDAYASLPGIAALTTALSQARMDASNAATTSPEHSLQALLAVNGEGPLSAAARMSELTDRSLSTTHLVATVTLSGKDSANPLSWRAQRIDASPIATGAGAPSVDLSALPQSAVTDASFMSDSDSIELSSVRFDAQLGALSVQALNKVVSSDKGGDGDEIRAMVGCATLSEWLGGQSYGQAGACDADCVQAACDRAIARLVGAAQTALGALDDTRPTLTLSGELSLSDENGDLVPERLSAQMLTGQWDPAPTASQGDAVSGAADATATP